MHLYYYQVVQLQLVVDSDIRLLTNGVPCSVDLKWCSNILKLENIIPQNNLPYIL